MSVPGVKEVLQKVEIERDVLRYTLGATETRSERIVYFAKVTLAVGLLVFTAAPRGMEASGAAVSDAMPAILRANSEWATAMQSGDVDMIVKPYANDAVFVTTAGESIRGREAIKGFLSRQAR